MRDTIPTYLQFLLLALLVWEIIWKGLALWRAARRREAGWFVALLFINTVGLFPIIYLLVTTNSDVAPLSNKGA